MQSHDVCPEGHSQLDDRQLVQLHLKLKYS
jgi:hypothetical protein